MAASGSKCSLGPLTPTSSVSGTHHSHISPGGFWKTRAVLFKAETIWVWTSHCRPFGGRSLPYPFPAALPEEGPFRVIVLLPWDTTGCSGKSGLSQGYLSLGQQPASSIAQGFTASFPDKNKESFPSFICGLRLCWKPQHVENESLSLPGGAGRLRRISNLFSVAAGTDGVKDLFKGGDPQVLSANPCKSTLLIAK